MIFILVILKPHFVLWRFLEKHEAKLFNENLNVIGEIKEKSYIYQRTVIKRELDPFYNLAFTMNSIFKNLSNNSSSSKSLFENIIKKDLSLFYSLVIQRIWLTSETKSLKLENLDCMEE